MVHEMMCPPFALDHPAVADHLEGEVVSVVDVAAAQHNLPQAAEGGFHRYASLTQAELDALSPGSTVM